MLAWSQVMVVAAALFVLVMVAAVVTRFVVERRAPAAEAEPHAEAEAARRPGHVAFEMLAARGTDEWFAAMREVGGRLREAGVTAIVFAHGSFVGDDPTSAIAFVERVMPAQKPLAQALRRHTRAAVSRLVGDHGNFGPSYIRLFEQAIGGTIPCTSFVWSSENHHVGRLEGALGLVRVLGTHASIAPRGRVLVLGHSHAGQLFALVTQLRSRSLAAEAIRDVARSRALDIGALDVDLEALDDVALDFVTFGAPTRYAWARHASVRCLHVAAGAESAALASHDWVRRLGSASTDFPAIAKGERALNGTLAPSLGASFDPRTLLRSLREAPPVPNEGELVHVDYGNGRLESLLTSGLGHAAYTKLDGMLFHATLLTERLYPRAHGTRLHHGIE